MNSAIIYYKDKLKDKMNNYTILHLHSMYSNPYSGLQIDSITKPEDYIKKAKELGMKAIAFTEHGSVLHNIAKKQMCDKVSIKYIHAEEFYVTESLSNRVRDNYHCCLFAKNYEGVKELNKLSSISMNRNDGHFYYTPRITYEELINTSDNIFINTACLAGILSKADSELKLNFIEFLFKNKHRCWLEIQPHNFSRQIEYNKKLIDLSKNLGIRLIATNDIHALNQNELEARKQMQKAKNVQFNDEDECDLVFKNYDELVEAFRKQGCTTDGIIQEAIEETNNFAEMIEDYDLDYSHKYPRLYADSKKEFKKRICGGVKERGINKFPNFRSEYLPRMKDEINTYVCNDAIDFMLLDSDYKNWMKENDINYGMSRGSVSGSLIAYLIHSTDVDPIKYDLNFSRFMNSERVSMADIDTDIYAEDRYKVREYFFDRADKTENLFCCNIITFNTIQIRGAIKDIGRSFGLTPQETQDICDTVYKEDKKEYVPDGIRNKYPKLFRYVDIVIDVITSVGRHAAGIVCSPNDLEYDFGLATIESDNRPVSQVDMHEIDSLNYVKMDLLGLNAVGLIDKTCKLAGIDYRTPDNMDFNDEKVVQSIAEDTTMIFQFESGFASDSLKKALSDNTLKKIKAKNPNASYIDIIAMTSGAIRPAGESYRDQLFNGEYNDYGNKELNDFFSSTLGWICYQEQIIDFLHHFCGFSMGKADIVRRGFAKKTGTEQYIPEIKDGFIKTMTTQHDMTKSEAETTIEYFLQVILDASDYLFSRNHAVPYSMIGYIIGWLRYYYQIELFTAALNIYQKNEEKSIAIKEYIRSKGYEIRDIQFGKSRAEYFMDKNENAIYQGIESIKYCNAQIGEELYALSQNNIYKSFIDLLIDIKDKTSVNDKQLKILIILNYFNKFGKNKYLLDVYNIYDTYEKCRVIPKSKLNNDMYNLVAMCANKETEKQFREIDNKKLVNLLVSKLDNKKLPIDMQIKAEYDYLGCSHSFKNDMNNNYYLVVDYKTYKDSTRPYFTLYRLNDGTIIKTKIKNSIIYQRDPFGLWDILKINEFTLHKKMKNINGKWIDSHETENVVDDFIVIKKNGNKKEK